ATTYQVPMTYRAQALAGAGDALIGTAEHGVLGHRWIYDAAHDPVLIAPLVALIQGDAEPQAQNASNTADLTVISQPVTDGSLTALESVVTANEPSGTDLQVETANAEGMRSGQLIVRIYRILQSGGVVPASESGQPCLSATWQLPDGTDVRGIIATAQYTQAPPARPESPVRIAVSPAASVYPARSGPVLSGESVLVPPRCHPGLARTRPACCPLEGPVRR